jgi:hypothetical protein
VAWNRDPAFLHIRGVSAARAAHVQVNSLYAYGGPYYSGYRENNRPLQPLNGRVMKLRRSSRRQ